MYIVHCNSIYSLAISSLGLQIISDHINCFTYFVGIILNVLHINLKGIYVYEMYERF